MFENQRSMAKSVILCEPRVSATTLGKAGPRGLFAPWARPGRGWSGRKRKPAEPPPPKAEEKQPVAPKEEKVDVSDVTNIVKQ